MAGHGPIELRHLRTLQALRDTGSVTGAAGRLHLTQSALSHQLRELEERLGCELFQRKTRPLRFTASGERLLVLADDVLARMTEAERDIGKLIHGEAGRLHMAIECHSCFNWLMPTVDQYRRQWPAVEMDFASGFLFEPLPALTGGEIDLVITSDPQPIHGIDYVPLFRYEMRIAVANEHVLATRPFLQPRDLRDQTVITYPVERRRLDIFHGFLDPAGVEPAGVRTTELTVMMVQLVASGRGVCALPDWVLDEYVRQGLVTTLAAGKEGIHPVLYAAVRKAQREAPFLRDFLALARARCLDTLPGVRAVTEDEGETISPGY